MMVIPIVMGMEINDGIERVYSPPELVWDLLDTPEIQRTEWIVNNGMAFKAFPSISYSRKAHMVCAARNGGEAFEALNKNGSNLPESFRLVLEALGITHDGGHSPYCHALARVVEGVTGESHEDFSARIVKGDLSFYEYFSQHPHLLGHPEYAKKILEKYGDKPRVPEILEKHGVNIDLMVQILSPRVAGREVSSENIFVRTLVDGVLIDIDKCAYIPMDSRAANIPEACADPSRVIDSLMVVESGNERRLAVSESALDTLCRFVAARKYLFQHCYAHKTVLKYETMISEAVKRSLPAFQDHNIEIHLLTDARLLHMLTEFDHVSAELALDIQFGRDEKFSEAYALKSRNIIEGSDAYERLVAVERYVSSHNGEPFPEDKIRDEIVRIANMGQGVEVCSSDVMVALRKYKGPSHYRRKMGSDMFIYSHKDPSVFYPFMQVVEGKGLIENVKAGDIFHELCKPDTSAYFVVYSRPELKERVCKAVEDFMSDLMKA